MCVLTKSVGGICIYFNTNEHEGNVHSSIVSLSKTFIARSSSYSVLCVLEMRPDSYACGTTANVRYLNDFTPESVIT